MTTSTRLVLVLNCGSSSVKYQVIDPEAQDPLAIGLIERVTDHGSAIRQVIGRLNEVEGLTLDSIKVVGHRIVQGGAKFVAPTVVTDEVVTGIKELIPLAPLHNPGHVAGLVAARQEFPDLPHVAIFDTAFHATLPPAAYTYAIDAKIAQEYQVRRYGFHGTSHQYVSRELARQLQRDLAEVNSIILHLGNGASACAVAAGRSVDTSMGLTPLEGLVMGSRSGDIDPAAIFYLMRTAGMSVDQVDNLLNKQSGLVGLTGHGDLRDVWDLADGGDAAAQQALEIYTYRIKGYIGKYLATLGRVDAIAFTAGVGENDDRIRAQSLAGLSGLGIEIDPERNAGRKSKPTLISPDHAAVAVWVIPTNEEHEIAHQALAALDNL